jgi:hypothetical protein
MIPEHFGLKHPFVSVTEKNELKFAIAIVLLTTPVINFSSLVESKAPNNSSYKILIITAISGNGDTIIIMDTI